MSKTIKAVIREQNIRAECEYVERDYQTHDTAYGSKFTVGMDVWNVTLRNNKRRQLTTRFSMGEGHNGNEPTAYDVLGSLLLDAQSVEWGSFESWCDEMGYDSDSRKAEKMYHDCEKEAVQLEKFLGFPPHEIDTSDY